MENTVREINYDKKTLRKDINKLSRILIYLELISVLIFIGWLCSYYIQEYSPNSILDPENVINAMKNQEWLLTIWYYIFVYIVRKH